MSDDFYDIMSLTTDRLRLKDKIVSNVAKAIKAIQRYQYDEEGVILSTSDWQCHRLCENLDHAFLHGLRHITSGYWKIVKEYTLKGTVKEIQRYDKITTDLGRGRAWLYLSLNECLLESYIRCLIDNEKHIKKYYMKEALVLDQQRMNVLLTLTSGLDFVTFQLEPNVSYLDLGTCPPKQQSSSSRKSSQDDQVSLHSMDSITSSWFSGLELSSTTPDSSKFLTDSDTGSLSSLDTTNGSSSTNKSHQYSMSLDSGCNVDNLVPKSSRSSITPPSETALNSSPCESESRLKRIESIPIADDVDVLRNDFEIIRVKSKGGKSKSTKRKKPSKKSTTTNHSSIANTRVCSTDVEENNNIGNHGNEDIVDTIHHSDIQSETKTNSEEIEREDSQLTTSSNSNETPLVSEESSSDHLHENLCENQCSITDVLNTDTEQDICAPVIVNGDTSSRSSNGDNIDTADARVSPNSMTHCHDGNQELLSENAIENSENTGECSDVEEDLYKVYNSCDNEAERNWEAGNSHQMKSAQDDYVKFISGEANESLLNGVSTSDFGDSCIAEKTSCESNDIDYSVSIDNNTMLHVMLEIFQEKDENLKKILSCRQGQTEGEVLVVFVLITDRRLYILQYKASSKRFAVQTSVSYDDIDFIVHGINYQVINVVCANKRKQFWLTTGDESLSRLIVDSMCEIVESSPLKIKKLPVFDDATTQKICLKKYIQQECHCEASDAKPEIYSLIYWEDPHSSQTKSETLSREGILYQRQHNALKGPEWKPVYVILRDGILCIFNEKTDSKPQSYLRMGGDQCVGCRRSQTIDKQHCIDIVLANGDTWQLAADNHMELSNWLLCMCRAVSEGMQADGTPFSCIPCCVVVTDQKILMCHEDIQTSFFRTLGSANIEEVTSIIEDSECNTYCILVFDSQDDNINSEEWILYFNSPKEKNKFTQALSQCWRRQFQVDIPTNVFDNITLQKHCQETAKILRNSLVL